MFYKYADREWGDDVTVISHWALPLRLSCGRCKLNSGNDFRTTMHKGKILKIIYERTITGSREEATIAQMIQHLEQHTKAGHKVHPAVLEVLYHELKRYADYYKRKGG